MTSREKVKQIFNRNSENAIAFWTGNPHEDTESAYLKQLGFTEREELFEYLRDDCRWIMADGGYKHPEGKPIFDIYGKKEKKAHGEGGYFATCDSIKEVEEFPWPDPKYLDFSSILQKVEKYPDKAVFTGLWSPFFHVIADFFGMENYFIKMYTQPEIVEAVTEHVITFLVEANDRFLTVLGDRADVFFFGNDFGTQLDLLISPEAFKRFVLPGFKKLIDIAKKHGKKVLLHSCGSIYKVIPLLIDAGIDALHPIQARAANMDAKTLAREFKNHIAFVGGVDTQDLLVNASPEEIRDEVRRIRDILGPNLIVSPSHEAILPNVPLKNVVAMAETARE
jgi:uroporphyrinogen decarboxylase